MIDRHKFESFLDVGRGLGNLVKEVKRQKLLILIQKEPRLCLKKEKISCSLLTPEAAKEAIDRIDT